MSIAPRSPPSSPSRKRVVQGISAPLRIQIPNWTPASLFSESTPALSSASESEPESVVNSPTTPRVLSPKKSATVVTVTSPLSPPTSDVVVDLLQLGSLSLSDNSKSKSNLVSPSRPTLGPIVFIRTLAKGSCGRPFVAWDKSTSSVLCAKVFYKNSLRNSPRQHTVRLMLAELRAYKRIADAEQTARNWLMEIHGVVQDASRILFVMDVMHADLFTVLEEAHIRSGHGVPDEISKRWIAQLALGIDSLHRMGIMHRDLKPENVLVSLGPDSDLHRSHLRITDFGHAWQAPGDNVDVHMRYLRDNVDPDQPLDWRRTYSSMYVGTPEYMAPEVHRCEPYGPMVDWWALGHLAYDIFAGQPLLPDERALQYFLKWQANPPDRKPSDNKGNYVFGLQSRHLMAVKPTERLRLTQLQTHAFFTLSDRSTVFDELRGTIPIRRPPERMSSTSIIHASACNEPVAYVRAKVPEPRASSREDELKEMLRPLSWINPHGLWAHIAAEDAGADVNTGTQKRTRNRGFTIS
ncbi:hypothetical protein NM688_g7232 [Phlebia brevispora]|uniref:Uncharacterized protein n=1 Tax=Phlebia brevispora TaxID=194682 RepID=A0ACC1S7Q5_9APHY|nr:hypothetical protein NM688_g7232 [Phlebia brevispora]